MSSYKLANVYISQTSEGLNKSTIDTGRYVAVIGHMMSGSSQYSLSDDDKFATGHVGTVFVYDTVTEYRDVMGLASGSDWSVGTFGSGSLGESAFDPTTNFMRAVELAFAGGAKRVYGCVLSGSGTSPTTVPDGLTEALEALRAFDDVYYIVVAGHEPLGVVKTEVVNASSEEIGKERVYVTGQSWNRAFSGSNMTYSLPSATTTVKDDNGRVICILANTTYKFIYATGDTTDSHLWTGESWSSGTHEIGGNWLAAYIAGKLSSQQPHVPLSYISDWVPSYKGNKNKAVLPNTKLESMWDDHLIFPRRWVSNNVESWSFDKGWLFTISDSPTDDDGNEMPTLITTRQIMDTISKDARSILTKFLFKGNNVITRSSANSSLRDKLNYRKGQGMIKAFDTEVYASANDETSNIMRARISIVPVFETLKIIVRVSAQLSI